MTRKRQERLQGIPNTVRKPSGIAHYEEVEVTEHKKETQWYLSTSRMLGQGFMWSLTIIVIEWVGNGPIDWMWALAPLFSAIGFALIGDHRELPKD